MPEDKLVTYIAFELVQRAEHPLYAKLVNMEIISMLRIVLTCDVEREFALGSETVLV